MTSHGACVHNHIGSDIGQDITWTNADLFLCEP